MDHDQVYFNSGVILFDIKRIKQTINDDIIGDCFKRLEEKIMYPDQDVLNVLYHRKVKYVNPNVYNNQLHLEWYQTSKAVKEAVETSYILHFVTEFKPWKEKYCNILDRIYLKYLKKVNPFFALYLWSCHKFYYVWRKLRDN